MTKRQADNLMIERFEALAAKADIGSDANELIAITDSMHKLYITLTNSGAFDLGTSETSNGFDN